MSNYYRRGDDIQKKPVFLAPEQVKPRPKTPVYLLQQNSEEKYAQGLMKNLAKHMSMNDSSYDNLNNLLLPKDVNYYYMEKEKVYSKIADGFNLEKTNIENCIEDFLKQVILMAENTKTEIFELIEEEKKTFYDFYDRFHVKITDFLKEAGIKLNKSIQAYNDYKNSLQRDLNDPLNYEVKRLSMDVKKIEEVRNIFTIIQKDYSGSSIPADKKQLEGFFTKIKTVDSQINIKLIQDNLKGLSEYMGMKIKDMHKTDFSQKVKKKLFTPVKKKDKNLNESLIDKLSSLNKEKKDVRNIVHSLNNMNNKFSPQQKESDQPSEEKQGSIIDLNLDSSLIKKEKRNVTFNIPDISSNKMKGSGLMDKFKNSNINININNVPQSNHNFINIYNQQNSLRNNYNEMHGKEYYESDKFKYYDKKFKRQDLKNKRPSSSIVTTNNRVFGTAEKKANTSFTLAERRNPSIQMSLNHTNLFTKFSVSCSRYRTDLIVEDHTTKISCFEILNSTNTVFYGDNKGGLHCCRFDIELAEVVDSESINLKHKINFIKQFKGNLLVSLDSETMNLQLISAKNLETKIIYKTYKEKIKLVAFHSSNKFLAITGKNKCFLYDATKNVPLKSFKITNLNIVDAIMASNSLLITASKCGEIKIYKVNFDNNQMGISGSLNLDCMVKSLDVFHNNEKLLIINTETEQGGRIFVLNNHTRKLMNSIKNPSNFVIDGLLTFTVVKKPPEILLFGFGENKIQYCDIDKNELRETVKHMGAESVHLRKDLGVGTKTVKILNQDYQGNTFMMGLCTGGIMLIKMS